MPEKLKKLRIKKTRGASAFSPVEEQVDPHDENQVEEEIDAQLANMLSHGATPPRAEDHAEGGLRSPPRRRVR